MTDTSLPLSEAVNHWLVAVDEASGAHLNAELSAQLMRGAALLLKVAKAHPSADARAAERWLSEVGLSLGLVSAVVGACGGMGAVAPMATRRGLSEGLLRVAEPSCKGGGDTRLDKQKKTPASVGTTPGAMTNIGECNVDRADCRS